MQQKVLLRSLTIVAASIVEYDKVKSTFEYIFFLFLLNLDI